MRSQAFGLGLLGALSLAETGYASPTYGSNSTRGCKVIPGDAAWPSQNQWNALNETVGGRLVATQLLGSMCHKESRPKLLSIEGYNDTACENLKGDYDLLETQYVLLSFFSLQSSMIY